jgi:N-terminal domain of anti-restriction factor ArdC
MNRKQEKPRADIYARITDRIIGDLGRGVRPWTRPWAVANTAGRITRPLRYNGQPYSGVNVILLWSEAVAKDFASPIWMTFRQAAELGGHVRRGETGTTVVYASRFTRTETDGNGDNVERDIPFLKAYTVFCVDQIDGLPERYYGGPQRPPLLSSGMQPPMRSSPTPALWCVTAARRRSTLHRPIISKCRRSRAFAMRRRTSPCGRMRRSIMPPSGLCRADVCSCGQVSSIVAACRHNRTAPCPTICSRPSQHWARLRTSRCRNYASKASFRWTRRRVKRSVSGPQQQNGATVTIGWHCEIAAGS